VEVKLFAFLLCPTSRAPVWLGARRVLLCCHCVRRKNFCLTPGCCFWSCWVWERPKFLSPSSPSQMSWWNGLNWVTGWVLRRWQVWRRRGLLSRSRGSSACGHPWPHMWGVSLYRDGQTEVHKYSEFFFKAFHAKSPLLLCCFPCAAGIPAW